MKDTSRVTLTCFACQTRATTTLQMTLDLPNVVWSKHLLFHERAGWTVERPANNPNVIWYCPSCNKEVS